MNEPVDLTNLGRRIWLRAFWGFDPWNGGYLGFTLEKNREYFISNFRPGDLVLIYGADNAETERDDRKQPLGFLEVAPVPIMDRDRMSPMDLDRKTERGWLKRWTYSVPVKRAWAVIKNHRVSIKDIATDTYVDRNFRVIANRGALLSERDRQRALQLVVRPVSVFGEIPIDSDENIEQPAEDFFRTTRGVKPFSSVCIANRLDGESWVYVLRLDGDIPSLLHRSRETMIERIVIKVGMSNDPDRRCAECNAGLPPKLNLRWLPYLKSAAYQSANDAFDAERQIKDLFERKFESLGGEFFVGPDKQIEIEFASSVRPLRKLSI